MIKKEQIEKLNNNITPLLCDKCIKAIDKLNQETKVTDLFKKRKLERANNMLCAKCKLKIIQEVYKK